MLVFVLPYIYIYKNLIKRLKPVSDDTFIKKRQQEGRGHQNLLQGQSDAFLSLSLSLSLKADHQLFGG